MLQTWHRWREPLAVLLLVALALMSVVHGITLSLAIEADNVNGPLGGVAGGDEFLLLLTAMAVLWCATPVPTRNEQSGEQSPHARPLAVIGLLVVGLTVVGWVVLAVWAVINVSRWPTPDPVYVLFVIEGILRLAIPAVALGMVLLAVGRTGVTRAADRAELSASTTPALPAEPTVEDQALVNVEPERLPAAWRVDDAAGAVWLTADDAAQGRPGLSWSRPGTDDPGDTHRSPTAESAGDGPSPQPRSRPMTDDDDLR